MEKDKIEEALGIIWKLKELEDDTIPRLKEEIKKELHEDVLDYLADNDFIVKKDNKVEFNPAGKDIAINITRRHRLAERLLHDVLMVAENEVESSACAFEHIISTGVEENICILLGHPKECPHGMIIPQGDCCRKAKTVIESIVISLSHLKAGESGKVAYVLTQHHPHLHKLMSMGIVPGTDILIHQTFPSYIIKIGETQLALEKDIAKDIYIRKK